MYSLQAQRDMHASQPVVAISSQVVLNNPPTQRTCGRRSSGVVCRANQPSNLAVESLEKALQTINKYIHESEKRRQKEKARAGPPDSGTGSASSQGREDSAAAAQGQGKLVSFRARASAQKPVKEPSASPERCLAAYLSLPLDQYNLLDPAWVTRDAGGDDRFLLRVPLFDVVGLDLQPQINVQVALDKRNKQVNFYADRLKVGEPQFDQDFKLNMHASLKRQPKQRAFSMGGLFMRGSGKNNSTGTSSTPSSSSASSGGTSSGSEVVSSGSSSSHADVNFSCSSSSGGHGSVGSSMEEQPELPPSVRLVDDGRADSSWPSSTATITSNCVPIPIDSTISSSSGSSSSTSDITGISISGGSTSDDELQAAGLEAPLATAALVQHPSGSAPSVQAAGTTNGTMLSRPQTGASDEGPHLHTAAGITLLHDQGGGTLHSTGTGPEGGRSSSSSQHSVAEQQLVSHHVVSSTILQAQGTPVHAATTSPTMSQPANHATPIPSISAHASPASSLALASSSSEINSSSRGTKASTSAGGGSASGQSASDAAAAAAMAEATAILSSNVDVRFTMMVPAPLSSVPDLLLSATGSLIARLAMHSLLPSFLDLLTVDYHRWASGLSRNTPAGSLLAQARKPTVSATEVIDTTAIVIDSGPTDVDVPCTVAAGASP